LEGEGKKGEKEGRKDRVILLPGRRGEGRKIRGEEKKEKGKKKTGDYNSLLALLVDRVTPSTSLVD